MTDEQSEILLDHFDNVHDGMHMMRSMADSLYEAAGDIERSLLEALKCLNAESFITPEDNVIKFPEGGRNE